MDSDLNFYWKNIHDRSIAIMDGSPEFNQLWVSVSYPHDSDSIGEIIQEIEAVLSEKLVETDFSSGETTDFVHVFKDKCYLYPKLGEEHRFEMNTNVLLRILKHWKEFISSPPKK